MNRTLDVAVLGAGIAGSSLAKSMADLGWETVLIDRMQFPRHKVCGEFLSPESLTMLGSLGLRELVLSLQPRSINRARVIVGNGNALEIPLPGNAIGISRYSLDTAFHLAAVNSGVHMQTATMISSVTPCERGYAIETKQGEERKTLYVRAAIAAWGANCRSCLPGHRPNRKIMNTYIGVKTHFSGIEMEPVVELYFFDGGYVGVTPIEGGIVNVAALLKRKAFQNNEKTILGLIEAACRRNPKLYQKLAHAVPVPGTQAAVAPVELNRKPLEWDIIPHVGDAAIMIPPLCGDGMSMALRSSLLCAPLADRYLAGDISLSEWRHEYSRSIRRDFNGPLRWGRLLQWLFDIPVVPRLLVNAAHFAPELAFGMVNATRLKEFDP